MLQGEVPCSTLTKNEVKNCSLIWVVIYYILDINNCCCYSRIQDTDTTKELEDCRVMNAKLIRYFLYVKVIFFLHIF